MKGTELLNILDKVKAGLGDKSFIEQFSHFIFKDGFVTAYNDEICVSHPTEGLDISTSVEADDLIKTVKLIGDDEIIFEIDENELRIKGGKVRGGLNALVEKKAERFIEGLGLTDIEWKSLPDSILKGLYFCSFSASKVLTQGILTCVHAKGNIIQSTDHLRISHYNLGENVDIDEMLIPARSIKDLLRFPAEEYCVKNGWVFFKTNADVIFCSRILQGDYPDLTQYLEVEGEQVEFPKSLASSIMGVSFMADGQVDSEKQVELTFGDGIITAKAEKVTGYVEKDIEWEGSMEFTINVNPGFLAEVMDKTNVATLSEHAIRFETENFVHMISLR